MWNELLSDINVAMLFGTNGAVEYWLNANEILFEKNYAVVG